ncbi:TIGR04255 family protein [Enterovibrio norvegicus]|uniref:TIGR04255 family protein n=1 Tax=Enterovibrio norvegicus TaxID=188144 RepID=UPI0010BEE86B|nr:TIGR04255 family protein [Enterovibrio norvegicus]TKF13713.1 TIGR04255 family protein [Enterovibrio norvegicus]
MTTKYQNPPVIYTVAKLIFAEAIGSYGHDKYKNLLNSLSSLGFDSWSVSKVMGVQLKQSDNQFTALPANVERVGYFSDDRRRCVVIDENSIELRLSAYNNHSEFLDNFKTLLNTCIDNGLAKGNKVREIELHYVDIFVPDSDNKLKDMFSSSVTLPMVQFYSDDSDLIKIGVTNFTRILQTGRSKVSVSLEQFGAVEPNRRKYLPDNLSEPDPKLTMPLDVERLFKHSEPSEYAIVHTACGSLIDMDKFDGEKLRSTLETQYVESRKTFDHMIRPEICEKLWEVSV